MKVQEYRDLIGSLSDAFASFRSAATHHEVRLELQRVKRLAAELEVAVCRRASGEDLLRADRWLAIVRHAAAATERELAQADCALARMAFGK